MTGAAGMRRDWVASSATNRRRGHGGRALQRVGELCGGVGEVHQSGPRAISGNLHRSGRVVSTIECESGSRAVASP
jgi:hypothetical protein